MIISNFTTRLTFAKHEPETTQKISHSLGAKPKSKSPKRGSPTALTKSETASTSPSSPYLSHPNPIPHNHAYLKLPGNTSITKLPLNLKRT
ncbi:MAG: hypothetical protein K940chlam9_00606 [Chlamydiae bacterium]|nr:hypothetical protein [Chlamydiota bacterium]